MLQSTDVNSTFVVSSKQSEDVIGSLNFIILSESISDNNLNSPNSASITSKLNSSGASFNKDIYVCTFCQVFSPALTDVAEHIATVHSQSLIPGTNPEDFVSKLQALNRNVKKKGKVGRPKKSLEKRFDSSKPKQPPEDPVPGPDDSEELDSHSDDSFIDSEGDEFKTHVDIDPVPWSRSKGYGGSKANLSSVSADTPVKTVECTKNTENTEITLNKVAPNWRNDSAYIPLFDDEDEKTAFEDHLKSINYSFVDGLFQKEEKRCRSNNTKNCFYVQSTVYRCNICKKVWKSLSHIRLHCLTHTDLKPFTCPKCDYSSNSKGTLYVHMRKHTGNVFGCSFCDFKSAKRAHLRDHEATHTSVPQFCKLCKNMYKTLRSLIAHIKRYHDNAGGKKYIKTLTSKEDKHVKCNICKKKFKSTEILNTHNRVCHTSDPTCDITQTDHTEMQSEQNLEEVIDSLQIQNPSGFEPPVEDVPCNRNPSKVPLADIVLNDLLQQEQNLEEVIDSLQIQNPSRFEPPVEDVPRNSIPSKVPLADIVLNDLLQQEQSQPTMYENVFSQFGENMLPSSFLPKVVLEDFLVKTISSLPSESPMDEDCQKALDLAILNQFLQNAEFSNECQMDFNLQTNMANECSLQNMSENNSKKGSLLREMPENKCEEPVEVKLFEKCQRAPAYVCCVCSSIYICPSTLKAHLKEHVNSTSSSFIEQPSEQFEPSRMPEVNSDLDNVCEMLQDASESYSFDKELEKLYTSSLDMMWYLPEVSVVLQNDPVLIDSVLDDISNFPMGDKYDTSQDLGVKDDDESVLKCFNEI